MTSRDIANMHVFLEMKNKFPDLPEETLRNYIFLYNDDQEKCINILKKMTQNSFFPGQPFAKPQRENKPDIGTTPTPTILDENELLGLFMQKAPSNRSGRSISHAGVNTPQSHPSYNSSNVKSAPILHSNAVPSYEMGDAYFSSHFSAPHDFNSNQMIFSTTKEHAVWPSDSNNSPTCSASLKPIQNPPRIPISVYPVPRTPHATPNEVRSYHTSVQKNVPAYHTKDVRDDHLSWLATSENQASRHSTSVNIVPAQPYQGTNHYNSNLTGMPGCHTTSVNLHLQPTASSQPPIQISSVPTNISYHSDHRNFGSHVSISVDAQGSTFTALRLQKPGRPSPREVISSHSQNSKVSGPSVNLKGSSARSGHAQTPHSRSDSSPHFNRQEAAGAFDSPMNFARGYEASPDYVKAVKKHQLAQLDILREEIRKESSECAKLKAEINDLGMKLAQKTQKNHGFSYSEMLKKLKDENRKLRIEVNCLFMEYDAAVKGQIPVGVTDEDFYSNIFTGPDDGLKLCSNGGHNSNCENVNKESSLPPDETDDDGDKWRCRVCTFANHPALEKCEMCELPMNSGSHFES